MGQNQVECPQDIPQITIFILKKNITQEFESDPPDILVPCRYQYIAIYIASSSAGHGQVYVGGFTLQVLGGGFHEMDCHNQSGYTNHNFESYLPAVTVALWLPD